MAEEAVLIMHLMNLYSQLFYAPPPCKLRILKGSFVDLFVVTPVGLKKNLL